MKITGGFRKESKARLVALDSMAASISPLNDSAH